MASKRSWSVTNSIIFAKKKSKIMKKCIDIILENCKNEYYGISTLDISACIVLGKAIMTSSEDINFIATDGELCRINPQKEKNYSYYFAFLMDNNDKIIAYRKPIFNNTDNAGDISCFGFEGTNNYVKMWKNKDVYDSSIKFPTRSTFKYQ